MKHPFFLACLGTIFFAAILFTFLHCWIVGHENAFIYMLETKQTIPWWKAYWIY